MAELILTEAEKSALTWMELDDATLGKVVKKTALSLKEHSEEQQKIWWFAAAMLLCGMAEDAKADQADPRPSRDSRKKVLAEVTGG
jgi:hypothetical protein